MAKKRAVVTRKLAVDVKEVWCHTITVQVPAGATREQIVKAVQTQIEEGDDGNTEYDRTLDPEQWTICDENGKFVTD